MPERVPVIAVHGGAADYRRRVIGPEHAEAGVAAVRAALAAGMAVLDAGGGAVDAAVAAVLVLEDDPALNAGHGASLTSAGHAELDAAVMDGATGRAGAVASVRTLRNPIDAARRIMEEGRHVLLVGDAAADHALGLGSASADPDSFVVPRQRAALEEWRSRPTTASGTVGAVALDRAGHLAAATSTGGMTGKLPGRVGDTPLIGAGTWADDATVAVSATGHGELFIRTAFAHHVHARMLFAGGSLPDATAAALDAVGAAGGFGGCVAVDRNGTVAMPFNSSAMFRGWATPHASAAGIEPGECEPHPVEGQPPSASGG